MISKDKLNGIINRRNSIFYKRYANYLEKLSEEYEIPRNVLLGIYLIETKYRPIHYRMFEYIATISGCILNVLSSRKLKNYTIGMCQMGISSILDCYGTSTYKHIRHIKKVDIKDIVIIIKSIYYKKNFRVCAVIVSEFYNRSMNMGDNYNIQLRQIGKLFNGKYSYGLLLEEIVVYLDTYENNNYMERIKAIY